MSLLTKTLYFKIQYLNGVYKFTLHFHRTGEFRAPEYDSFEQDVRARTDLNILITINKEVNANTLDSRRYR